MAIDLGCGPGWYTAALGEPVVALDAARSMVRRAVEVAPDEPGGAGRPRCPPLPPRVARRRLGPEHLRAPPPGRGADGVQRPPPRPRARRADRGDGVRRRGGGLRGVPGRRPSRPVVLDVDGGPAARRAARRRLRRRRARQRRPRPATRPSRSGPVGRRPCPTSSAPGCGCWSAASTRACTPPTPGSGYVTPGNRFWPAALEAGLASRDRDARHALRHHGMGMTDLVKRATPRAAELTRDEYRDGLARLDRLCAWLQPAAVCFVGLAGWRAAVDRHAQPGWQPRARRRVARRTSCRPPAASTPRPRSRCSSTTSAPSSPAHPQQYVPRHDAAP